MKIRVTPIISWIIKAFHRSFDTFCAHTYIHGFQFLSNVSQPSSRIFDKIFWSIVLSVMLLSSAFGCDLFLYRFNENAVKNYIVTDYMSIGYVSFPAITICPTQKIISTKLKKIIQNNNLEGLNLTLLRNALTYFDFKAFRYMSLIKEEEIKVLTEFRHATKLETFELMKLVSYNCDELLVKCRLDGTITRCKKLFKVSGSHEGFCCSFNYDDQHRTSSKPISSNYFGIKYGLSVALNIPKSEYYSSIYSSAAKLLIHLPQSYPSFIVPEVLIAHNTETIVNLKPQVITANDAVKALPVTNRNCYLKEERALEYFGVYSHQNCIVECLMHQIYDDCLCVPYFFPSYTNLTICDETAIICVQGHIVEVLNAKSNDGYVKACDCLFTCNKLTYAYNLQSAPFISPTYTIDPFYTGLNDTHTILHVPMSKQTLRIINAELSLNWIQLIANIGGIVSLFTGVSMVSFTHMIYFATAKWILYIRDEFNFSRIYKKRIQFRQRLEKY